MRVTPAAAEREHSQKQRFLNGFATLDPNHRLHYSCQAPGQGKGRGDWERPSQRRSSNRRPGEGKLL